MAKQSWTSLSSALQQSTIMGRKKAKQDAHAVAAVLVQVQAYGQITKINPNHFK